jgi:hypothetical protein
LPDKFRNTEAYDPGFIEALESMENVVVFQGGIDMGPVMKILPTLERLALECNRTETEGPEGPDGTAEGPDDRYVISLDDDMVYPNTLMTTVSNYIKKNPSSILAGKIEPFKKHKIPFGLNGIVYPVKLFTPETLGLLKKYSSLAECRNHDDMAIGLTIEAQKLPLIKVKIQLGPRLPESFGKQSLWYTESDDIKSMKCSRAILESI